MANSKELGYAEVKQANDQLRFQHYSGQHDKLVFGCTECTKRTESVDTSKLEQAIKEKFKKAAGEALDEIETACCDLSDDDSFGLAEVAIKRIREQVEKLDDLLFSE